MSGFTIQEWAETKQAHYDLNKEFSEQVEPVLQEFSALCKEFGVPFVAHFVPAQSEVGCENVLEVYTHHASRTTPELMAQMIVSNLTWEHYNELRDFYDVCVDKFGPEKVTPDPLLAAYEGDEFTLENWLHTPLEEYDCIAVYKERMEPLARKIKDICVALNLPMHMMAVAKYEGHQSHSHSCGCLGGIEHATPEIISAVELVNFNPDSIEHVSWILDAADKKYGRPQHMDIEGLIAKLLG